jgi:putative PEP-CTERM system TPR-repeat lipoprotein
LQLKAGATREALDTYVNVARLQPSSADVQYRLAALQYLVVNSTVAKQTAHKALDLNPNHEQALNLLAKLEADGGNRDAALKLVERVKKLMPSSPAAFVLEGDVEMLGKRYANAVKAYERAYSLGKSGILAAQIHQAYWRAGKPEQGEPVVLKWLEEHPNDASTRKYLADTSLQAKRVAVAIPHYEWLAQNRPRDQQVLNNLAWAYDANADARALATAEAALKLDEKNPVATDTYGWMLYRNERFAEAVDVLRRAVTLAPNEREVRYHYVQALVKTGDRRNARLELERVLAGSTPFSRQAEARPLLDQLRN